MSGWETPPLVDVSGSPLHRMAATPRSGHCKRPFGRVLVNFRSLFLNAKELVFGRILHAQCCGGDTVSSAISHFAYLHLPPGLHLNQ